MLRSLQISNYALIDKLTVDWHEGFNIITGETGAGKSIILGALGLILGQRADVRVLYDKEQKCIVEGVFLIGGYGLENFFAREELDYDEQAILRREITTAGKSRAFVNDTPVTLKTLGDLALRLVDIHSQHQNLDLGTRVFQLQLVDTVANNAALLDEYGMGFKSMINARQRLAQLCEEVDKAKKDLDYFQFQFNQLAEARLKEDEQEELETELATLEHAEEIKMVFGKLGEDMEKEDTGWLYRLKESIQQVDRMAAFMPEAVGIRERLESCYLELKDICDESFLISEKTEYDQERIRFVSSRLDLIYSLQQKFRVHTVGELVELKNELGNRMLQIDSFERDITAVEGELEAFTDKVGKMAEAISEKRKSVAEKIEHAVVGVLQKLGMANVVFKVEFERLSQPAIKGIDEIRFLFSANRNMEPRDISSIASGGEISRVMLALKTLITDSKSLPTIVFDEIDSGISGEVALKMGSILKDMAEHMQILNITHLPQIAGKGHHHFKVYKYDTGQRTHIAMRKLSDDERVEELALMLSGEKESETAKETAKELLFNKKM